MSKGWKFRQSGSKIPMLLVQGAVIASAASLSGTAMAQNAGPAAAPAAEQGNSELGDIVVTARKRAESLLAVPVAVSALSQQDITRYNATDLGKVAQLAPQVIINRGQSGGGANLVIRGLGSGSGDQGLEQTVSVNIDGVQVGRGRIVSMGFFDLKQVEILKGPQALYFGKNSPAGVISLTSAGPTDTLSGYVRGGYEFNAREKYVEAAISGPLAPNLKARLALRGRWMDGYLINTAVPGPNPFDARFPAAGAPHPREPKTADLIGRLTVQYDPSSQTQVTLRVFGGKTKEGGFTSIQQPVCVAPATSYTVLGQPQPQVDCQFDKYTQVGGLVQNFPLTGWTGIRDGQPYQDTVTSLSSLTINQELGEHLSLTSVTGYFDLNFKGAGNSSQSPLSVFYSTISEHTKTFTQELRLNSSYDGPVNFTVGGYYSHNSMSGYVTSLQFIVPIVPDAQGRNFTYERRTSASGESYSAFGQVRWNPIEQVEVAGGVRYTHETKKASTGNVYVTAPAVGSFRPVNDFLGGNTKEDNYSPEITVSYHPQRDMTIYAAYKTGYLAGGISQPSVMSRAYTQDNIIFRPEKTSGFEAGIKGLIFDGKLRFDLTAYSYRVTDYQVVALLSNGTSLLTNAANASTKGIEGSVQFKPVEQLTLRAAFGYNRARFKNFNTSACYTGQPTFTTAADVAAGSSLVPTGFCQATLITATGQTRRTQDLSGLPLPRAPEMVINGGFTFDQPVGDNLMVSLDADFTHSSTIYTQDNLNPAAIQTAYTLVNAGIRVGPKDDGWQLALIGRNLTNKYYKLLSIDAVVGAANTFAPYTQRPREITVQATYRF